MSEHDEQAALFRWAELNEGRWPELEMLYAIPNGGHRHKAVAGKLKAEGVKAGVWDVALDVPRGRYHGLKIEMKWDNNNLTNNQELWGSRYDRYGYDTAVCWDWLDAAHAILTYLGIDESEWPR